MYKLASSIKRKLSPSSRVLTSILVFTVLFVNFSPALTVLAQEEETTNNETAVVPVEEETEPTEATEPEQPAEEPTTAPVEEPNAPVEETVNEPVDEQAQPAEDAQQSAEEGEILSTTIAGNKVTYGNVKTGVDYKYFKNEAVSLKFISLPEGDYYLSIEEVATEYGTGYEFLSNLTDGTFKYDLRLPNTKNTTDVEVQYSEDGENYTVLAGQSTIEKTVVSLSNLSHFTVFVITKPAAVIVSGDSIVDSLITKDNRPELTGNINSGDAPANMNITVDGNTYNVTTDGTGTWTLPNDTVLPSIPDGVYDVVTSYINNDGDTILDSTANELMVDTVAPTGSIITPASGTIVSGSFTLTGTASDTLSGFGDLSGIPDNGKIRVRFHQGVLIRQCLVSASDYDGSLNFTLAVNSIGGICNVPDGTYTIRVYSYDRALNIAYGAIGATNVTIDNPGPDVGTVNVTQVYGNYVRSYQDATNPGFDIYMDASDTDGIASCEYALDFNNSVGTWLPATYDGTKCIVTGLGATDGAELLINMRVTDSLGYSNIGGVVSKIADSALPVITSFTVSPDSNGFTSNSVVLTAIATDTSSPMVNCSFAYEINGDGIWHGVSMADTVVPNADPKIITCTKSYSGLNDGDVIRFRVRATDSVSLTTARTYLTRKIDGEIPVISDLPDKTFNEGDTFDVAEFNGVLTVSDNIGLSEIFISIDSPIGSTGGFVNLDISSFGTGGTVSGIPSGILLIPIDTSVLWEGTYTFEYYVTDLAGNRSDCDPDTAGEQNCVTTVVINNVTPIVTFATDQTINEGGTASFTGSFEDPSYIGDSLFYSGPNDPDDANWWPMIDYGDGEWAYLVGGMEVPGTLPSIPDHVYSNSGIYTAILWVCEDSEEFHPDFEDPGNPIPFNPLSEGTCGYSEVTITVNNLAPTVVITANPGTSVNEGTVVTLTANGSGGNAPLTYSWGGDCSGTATTYALPSTPGTYTCLVTVTDVDGDTSTDSITVTVKDVVPAQDTTNDNPSPTTTPQVLGIGDVVTPDEEDKTDEETEEEDEDGEVLGLDCEEESRVSGYVYYDENGNGKKDKDEEGLKDVTVKLYAEIDGDRKLISSTSTDENGYWQTEVCPADYEVEIDEDDLPSRAKVKGDDTLEISVDKDEETNDVNFTIEQNDLFGWWSWWYCLVCLALLALLAGGVLLFRRRREEK